jgi:GT2 family glycosyltransferase
VGDNLNVAARFIKKALFDRIHGFDETLTAAEDYDLHNRLLAGGYKIGQITAKEVHLGEPSNLAEIVIKHYYYGKTIRAFLKKNPQRGKQQVIPLRRALFRNWRKFADQPALALGFAVYQTVRYTSAFFGYASTTFSGYAWRLKS